MENHGISDVDPRFKEALEMLGEIQEYLIVQAKVPPVQGEPIITTLKRALEDRTQRTSRRRGTVQTVIMSEKAACLLLASRARGLGTGGYGRIPPDMSDGDQRHTFEVGAKYDVLQIIKGWRHYRQMQGRLPRIKIKLSDIINRRAGLQAQIEASKMTLEINQKSFEMRMDSERNLATEQLVVEDANRHIGELEQQLELVVKEETSLEKELGAIKGNQQNVFRARHHVPRKAELTVTVEWPIDGSPAVVAGEPGGKARSSPTTPALT